jgi:RNA polymerase sigma-70 factor (ECF subfamily)
MDSEREDPDRENVRRVLAGDVTAFDGIVRRWQGPMVNLAYRFCRDRGNAEEMAQEAFLRAYRFLDRWGQDSLFSTWLFAVATNVYRSQMRRVRPPEVPLEAERQIRGPGNPAGEFETAETAEAVRRSVCSLPEKYRDALVLFYFHDMNIEGAASCLGVPVGTVKARLHRGRALLRRRLAKILGPRLSAEAT